MKISPPPKKKWGDGGGVRTGGRGGSDRGLRAGLGAGVGVVSGVVGQVWPGMVGLEGWGLVEGEGVGW